jgi:hypothetical protein
MSITQIEKVLYTSKTHTTGGRDGGGSIVFPVGLRPSSPRCGCNCGCTRLDATNILSIWHSSLCPQDFL